MTTSWASAKVTRPEWVREECKQPFGHCHTRYRALADDENSKLSGGELQRIAIARAILKRPDIVLLDEATSSVDTETEQKIQGGLQALCEGRTTFIVALVASIILFGVHKLIKCAVTVSRRS